MQVSIQRRCQWGARILLPEIEGPYFDHAFRCLEQLYLDVRRVRGGIPCKIGERGKQDCSRWQAITSITQCDKGRKRETSASRTASDDDLPGLSSCGQQPAISRERIVHSCRERMLWSQAIVHRQNPLPADTCQGRCEHPFGAGRSQDIASPVQIEDHSLSLLRCPSFN